MRQLIAATGPALPSTAPDIGSLQDVLDLLRDSVAGLVAVFIENLPIYLIALAVFALGMFGVRYLQRAGERTLRRSSLDTSLQKLAGTVLRIVLVGVLLMVALSVAGVQVGAALAALGLLGLALAFAFQNILENFIAGLLILVGKPLRIGDQVISGEFEGTVVDINMRVTKVRSYDGVMQLLPNADVFRTPLVNLTELGTRRSSVEFGVDYRDDADVVADVVVSAVQQLEGVLQEPAVEVLCTGLGESSVDFEVRYWTAADRRTTQLTRDRVVRATKRAVEDAGMSIPWPIRTLEAGEEFARFLASER